MAAKKIIKLTRRRKQINAKKQIKLKGKFPGIKKGTSSLTSSQKKSATVALAI